MNMRSGQQRFVVSIAQLAISAMLLLSATREVPAAQGVGETCHIGKPCGGGLSCMPFRQVCHRDSGGLEGEACQAGYGCAGGFTCEAGSQVCRGPGKVGDSCHATKPCGSELSCAPGVQKCYNSPRLAGQPCVAGYPCGSGLACAPGSQVCYMLPPSPPFNNGQAKRPFYIVGHNPNTLEEMKGDIDAGANGLEPDIMKFSDNAQYTVGKSINDSKGPSGLFVYHDSVLVTTRMPMTVETYFAEVAKLISAGKNIALITVDTKPPVYGSGAALVTAIHDAFKNLPAASKPWVIYNTGDNNAETDKLFTDIAGMLTDREGMMIDGAFEPTGVYNKLLGKTKNSYIGYGTGGQGFSSGSFPKLSLWIDLATWIRTSQGLKASVPYVYPVPSSDLAAGVDWWGSFMDSGVDGLIPDLDFNPTVPATTQSQIKKLKAKLGTRSDYYLATAKDNPFGNGLEGYALRVDTASAAASGTDGYVTFTLRGSKGSSSAVFNGRTSIGSETRFHAGGRDHLVIPSKDLGKLIDLTIYVSGAVHHSWSVKQIQISSASYGIPYQNQPDIAIDKTVSTTNPVVVNLGANNLGRP